MALVLAFALPLDLGFAFACCFGEASLDLLPELEFEPEPELEEEDEADLEDSAGAEGALGRSTSLLHSLDTAPFAFVFGLGLGTMIGRSGIRATACTATSCGERAATSSTSSGMTSWRLGFGGMVSSNRS